MNPASESATSRGDVVEQPDDTIEPPGDITQTVDKSANRVRQMFSEIAPQYDRMNHLLSMNVDRLWRRYTVRKLAPGPGDRILDVCTGTGDLALAFNKRLRGQGTVIGTDFCEEMLEVARQKPVSAGAVQFLHADAQALPFEDDSFDIVTVAFGLRNVEDTDLGLRELTRVCRSGGQIGILEFTTPRRWPVRPLYGWYFRNVLPRIGQSLARNNLNAYDYLPQSVGEFPSYEKLTECMCSAGMSSATYFPLTFGIATLYVGKK
ncbi:MAG: bifunctional demethylmenaquinone methyltransferase/2-methoxy-6-polyprenyl-1,4-benzoquinol methylase UbiE [Pirellulaceae bacterium]